MKMKAVWSYKKEVHRYGECHGQDPLGWCPGVDWVDWKVSRKDMMPGIEGAAIGVLIDRFYSLRGGNRLMQSRSGRIRMMQSPSCARDT